MKTIFTLLILVFTFSLQAQTDYYYQLQLKYDSLRQEDNYEEGLELAREMNTWAYENETDSSIRYAMSYISLGDCYYHLNQVDSAKTYWDYSLKVLKFQNREDHPETANCLNYLGNLYSDLFEYKSAEPYYIQALEIRKKALGEEHMDYAKSLNNLGLNYNRMRDYKSAEPYLKKALEIFKISLGEDHPYIVTVLVNLGSLYQEMGDYKSAERIYIQSIEIAKQAFGENHPTYAVCLGGISNLYIDLTLFEPAEFYLKQSLENLKKSLGEDHYNTATVKSYIGKLYFEMGEYKSASNYFNQSAKSYSINSKSVYPTVGVLLNLGELCRNMGDFKCAESNVNKAFELLKKTENENDPLMIATLFHSLSSTHSAKGDYKSAESCLVQALEIRKKAFGEEHMDYAESLADLGLIYLDVGDYETAELNLKKALEIFKISLGEDHLHIAFIFNDLGTLYFKKGDYKTAENYYEQALEIVKNVSGDESTDYADLLDNLAMTYSEMGDFKSAEEHLKRVLDIKMRNLAINFSWLSKIEKEKYWAQQNKSYYLNDFAIKATSEIPSASTLAYDGNLVSKSLLMETSRELDRELSASTDTYNMENYQRLKFIRKNYSKLVSEGSDDFELIERLNREADSLDKILINSLGEYSNSKRKFEITWKNVQANLSSSESAIEFAKYYDDKDSLYKYMALVVRPDYEYPEIVKLGEEQQIKDAVDAKDFNSLFNLVWQGIDSLLIGVKTVYYSPTGELNNVAFSALCAQASASQHTVNGVESNRGVITQPEKTSSQACNLVLMDKYELYQLTTTRYLADGTLKQDKFLQPTLTLIGGINFDDVPEYRQLEDNEQSNEDFLLQASIRNQATSTKTRKRGKRSSSYYGRKFDYLPGTKEEVTNIASLMTKSNWKVQIKSDNRAGEYEFKEELEKTAPGVLHIATHGFAFPDKVKSENSSMELGQSSTYTVSEDPMVRCGLMLSGSNISWTGQSQKMIQQTGDDGILTAAEVANLDLSKTKLVVLSACETGLGKIEGSEGTFGLKRGFKLAGVEQIIVSLWSVPDKETTELMTVFYEDLTRSLNPVTSFKKAQMQMRDKYPLEPEKWAGFVLVR